MHIIFSFTLSRPPTNYYEIDNFKQLNCLHCVCVCVFKIKCNNISMNVFLYPIDTAGVNIALSSVFSLYNTPLPPRIILSLSLSIQYVRNTFFFSICNKYFHVRMK